jgi:hypothetical protein
VLCSLQDHLRIGMCDLYHPILIGAENTNNWHARKGDLQRSFPLDVPMVASPQLSFVANSSNPTNVGFALGETISFDSLVFTVDHPGRLSLSPKEQDSCAIFIGMVHGGSPSLHTALEDSLDEDDATSGTRGFLDPPDPNDATW